MITNLSLCLVAMTIQAAEDPAPVLEPRVEPESELLELWPQWRGPTRDGRFHGPEWPGELTPENLVRVWRVDLGEGYSGPVVAADRVFTVETREKELEIVRAFDRGSGEPLWQRSWEGSMRVPFFAARNGSWVRSTPAYDGESLFVAGMRDLLVCLDAESGDVRWKVDFIERYGTPLPDFGFVCSPLVVGDHVYVQAGASFCKLDKASGETLWRSMVDAGGMFGGAFSSPILASLRGQEQLLVLSRTTLAGVAPADGRVVWSTPVKSFRGMNILTPLAVEDGVFTAPYGGRAQLLRIDASDDGFEVARVWDDGSQGYMTSPVVVDGYAYLFLRSGRFACFRIADGERGFVSPPTEDTYWSLVVRGERILALTQGGELILLEANPEEYTELGRVRVSEQETWAHLGLSGRQLFVREQKGLAVYRWD